MGERTIQELHEKQALPLSLKVRLTKQRIRDWVNEFGEDGVCVSFSGGKDSTVLLRLVREEYPNIPAVFCDTGLEFPEIRDFVKTFDNVTWLKPRKTFRQVLSDYGYPFISKEVAERVYFAGKYLKAKRDLNAPVQEDWEDILRRFAEGGGKGTYKIKELFGLVRPGSKFDYSKWRWLAASPAQFSGRCCDVMKKNPTHIYHAHTGRKTMLGQMACESRLRTMQWLHHGCNGFDMKVPISMPMAFWTEQDVLQYIYQNKLQIASVYGDVVVDYDGMGELDGQMRLDDLSPDLGIFDLERPLFKTTGCKRTGCMFCGFGCHMEKPGEGRFEQMKITHPKQYEYIMRPWNEGGLGYKEVIDWINEHGNLHIRY